MSDAEIYGWETVHAYHALLLQQSENDRAEWKDTDAKLEFHRPLVWNLVPPGSIAKISVQVAT